MSTARGQAAGPARGGVRRTGWPDAWGLAALLVLALILAPILSVVLLALNPAQPVWDHLSSTVLPRYLGTSLRLMAGVALLAGAIGAGAAWIVTIYRFPGSRFLALALMAPLAIPAYVAAYSLVDVLDYSGAVQGAIRQVFGFASARDYWFPEVRSEGAAILVLAFALYPYVYLLARQAFREQSGGVFEAGRSLGLGHWGLFWRLGLPLARPALAAGVALALMETLADFGTVSHFGVQTLTTGIFSTWLSAGNAGGAAQLALVALALILVLTLMERGGRRRARFNRPTRAMRPLAPLQLRGGAAALAAGLCALPVVIGFVLPVAVMAWLGLQRPAAWITPDLGRAALNSVGIGLCAAALTLGLALLLDQALRLSSIGRGLRLALPLTLLGYAAPGAVLAVGILIPLAALDHLLADGLEALSGQRVGLLLTGTAFAVVLACSIRFFGIAQGAVEAASGRVPPSLTHAARSLGHGAGSTFRLVQMPLMRGSVLTALLLVFVDTVKELPATLLLRPFNFDTLATRTYDLASLERLEEAAPAALIVMALGLVAVLALARAELRGGAGGAN